MSKAILIIDMPNRCEECPCYQPEMNYETVEYHFCGVDGHVVSGNDLPKYDGCPLKPMPERFEPTILTDYCLGNADGWNACIGEILGEEEDE